PTSRRRLCSTTTRPPAWSLRTRVVTTWRPIPAATADTSGCLAEDVSGVSAVLLCQARAASVAVALLRNSARGSGLRHAQPNRPDDDGRHRAAPRSGGCMAVAGLVDRRWHRVAGRQ